MLMKLTTPCYYAHHIFLLFDAVRRSQHPRRVNDNASAPVTHVAETRHVQLDGNLKNCNIFSLYIYYIYVFNLKNCIKYFDKIMSIYICLLYDIYLLHLYFTFIYFYNFDLKISIHI